MEQREMRALLVQANEGHANTISSAGNLSIAITLRVVHHFIARTDNE